MLLVKLNQIIYSIFYINLVNFVYRFFGFFLYMCKFQLSFSFLMNYQVTVENFVRVLTGRVPASTPRSKRLLSDENSNIFIYLTGSFPNFVFHSRHSNIQFVNSLILHLSAYWQESQDRWDRRDRRWVRKRGI